MPSLKKLRIVIPIPLLPIAAILSLSTAIGGLFDRAEARESWWNKKWSYRVPITVQAAGYERLEQTVETSINFTQLLRGRKTKVAVYQKSIRVIETNASGQVIDEAVPFQFDPDNDFSPTQKAKGTLVFIMRGTTPINKTRRYHLYFDTVGNSFSPPNVVRQVNLTEHAEYEQDKSYKIETKAATYYYHKTGAGFASIEDRDGKDWIGFRPGGRASGHYRGIPNLGPFAHPGYGTTDKLDQGAETRILNQGPIKITISSQQKKKSWFSLMGIVSNLMEVISMRWKLKWEFYPHHARMTLLSKGLGEYWFLYEGTPGGGVQQEKDFCVRSDGSKSKLSQPWVEDLPDPEWVYFADGTLNRSLYFVHEDDDNLPDSYKPMGGNAGMTVFGFGRGGASKMTQVPNRFTIGLVESKNIHEVTKLLNSAFRPLTVSVGKPVSRSSGS